MSQPSSPATSRGRDRLVGLGAAAGISLFIAGTPLLLLAIGVRPWEENPSGVATVLTSPDDGTLAFLIAGVVVWLCWAIGTALFAVEILAGLRGFRAPHLPGLGVPQHFAGRAVATAALLFAAAPTVAPVFAPPPAHATPAAQGPAVVVPETAPPAVIVTGEVAAATFDYTVRRGDSLWRLAERFLGDGKRFKEIHALNRQAIGDDPDFLLPGTVLRIPLEGNGSTEPGQRIHTVVPGEWLTTIAADQLGDANRHMEIYHASKHIIQPDGDRLTDPDLIRPGWRLIIPSTTAGTPPQITPPKASDPPADPTEGPPTSQPSKPPPSEVSTPEPDPEPAASPADKIDAPDKDEVGAPVWMLPGLAGAGAVLAGGMLIAVRAHQRTQLRYRRPGQILAPPPPDFAAVEKTVFVAGSSTAGAIGNLDRVLRHLAAVLASEGRALPAIVSVALAEDSARLTLASPAKLPSLWVGEGICWTVQFEDSVPESDVLPPYPLLVSIGQDESGVLHLVNLEHFGAVTLSGDPDHAVALARHLAAELALNPWSLLVDVHAIGIGDELADLEPMRLRCHEPGDVILGQIVADLNAAERNGLGDPEPYRAVITTASDEAADVARVLSAATSRLGAVVVAVLSDTAIPGATTVEVTGGQRVRIDRLGLDVDAAGLSHVAAGACAALVNLTRENPVVTMPVFEQATEGWRSLTDRAGALRDNLTDVRDDSPGEGSLLPEASGHYTEAGAATAGDLEVLAPSVPDHVREIVEHTDPNLDDDLEAWFDPTEPLPKVSVLGPVRARSRGDASAVAGRKPHYTEMLTFLALHPEGVTSERVAEAFALSKPRARTDLGIVRKWLGTNPRTGRPHLPSAADSQAALETGITTYQLEDVLVDADLFRRLRARGQARGEVGQTDLDAALGLVTGQPFDQLRETGWSWLLDSDERLHETLACAVVDVAHVVVTDALASEDVSRARRAADVARTASPYDEVARLDHVTVLRAEGHEDAAQRFLYDEICNRSDDPYAPIDLPERTAQIVKNARQRHAPRNQT